MVQPLAMTPSSFVIYIYFWCLFASTCLIRILCFNHGTVNIIIHILVKCIVTKRCKSDFNELWQSHSGIAILQEYSSKNCAKVLIFTKYQYKFLCNCNTDRVESINLPAPPPPPPPFLILGQYIGQLCQKGLLILCRKGVPAKIAKHFYHWLQYNVLSFAIMYSNC